LEEDEEEEGCRRGRRVEILHINKILINFLRY